MLFTFAKSKNMISKIKYGYLLLFIAVVWGLFFSFTLQLQPYFSTEGDDRSYLEAARLLYAHGTLDGIRPMLVAALFGLPYAFGLSTAVVIKWVFVLNFLCWFGTVMLVFKIAASHYGRQTAFMVAVLFLLCIGNLAHAFRFLSEPVFIFLLLLSLYFANAYFLKQQPKYLTIAISILFFNALIKPVAVGMSVVMLLFFIKKIKDIVTNRYASFLALGIGMLVFQVFSLKKTYGDYTLSYIGSITYYNYLGAKADCYRKGIEYLPGEIARTTAYNRLSCNTMKKTADRDLSEQLKNNTFNLFRAYLFCMYSNSSKGNYIVSECRNAGHTSYFDFFRLFFKAVSKLQTIILTITGVAFSFYILLKRKSQNPVLVLFSAILLYIFFISAISCYECDRFHIAFFPLVLLMFGHFYHKKSLHV